jgi:hypothetical protein
MRPRLSLLNHRRVLDHVTQTIPLSNNSHLSNTTITKLPQAEFNLMLAKLFI